MTENQLSIDFATISHARNSDPATSKDSAARVREFAGGHCSVILRLLNERGPMTCDEIAKHLEHADLARPLAFHRMTASGRKERLWETS